MRISLAAAMMLAACTASDAEEPWTLVWQDEFSGAVDSPPDAANWVSDSGGDGFGNEQLEYNTDRPENVSVDGNGFLRIVAKREEYEGNSWTSGRIITKDLQAFEYGRVEARIRLPSGRGIWPAFWMLGDDIDEVSWPSCGEIDILEMRGEQPDTIIGSVHGPGYSGGSAVSDALVKEEVDFSADFHSYEIVWDPGNITWAVDGEILNSATPGDLPQFTTWVFDHPFFLILNVAVGGTFLEEPDDTTPDEVRMVVDHVRVYQRTNPIVTVP
jgi:beta-glucanase (GH16 family)